VNEASSANAGTSHAGEPSELGALLRLAWPIALAQFGLVTMSLVDTAALGRVSVQDLAGGGIGRSLGFTTIMVGIGVAGGLEPLAAQAIGAGEPEKAWQGYLTNVRATLSTWPAAMAVAFGVTMVLAPFGVDPHVVARVRLYMLAQAPGLAAALAYHSTKALLLTHTCTRPVLIGSIVANVVNFPLVNVLVRGDAALRAVGLPAVGLPALGALGGGIAFSIGVFVMLAAVVLAALRFRVPGAAKSVPIATAYRLGLPVGFQMLAEVGVFAIAALLAGVIGAEAASAHNIALGMASLTFMGAVGVSGATSVRVGYAVGEGRSARRAGMTGIALGAGVMMPGALAFAAAPELIASAFTHDDRVIAIAVDLLRIAALFQVFDGIQVAAAGALRGAGDIRFPFVANVAAHWGVGFPAALLLGFVFHRGAQGLWWGLTAGLVFVSGLLAARFAAITSKAIARVE
jgi:MATE family multidrug resistance protein